MSAAEFTQQVLGMNRTLQTFTYRFTRNKEDSLDLVQDTMLKALTYRDKFRNDTNLKGWLFTIMRNIFINNYRKAVRMRTANDTTKELYFLNVEDNHTFRCPDTHYEYKDILKNISDIKEELRTPFTMYTSGYKYHEIADHLGIPIGTVKNRIFHARKELQEKLTGY